MTAHSSKPGQVTNSGLSRRQSVNILGVTVDYLPLKDFLEQVLVWAHSEGRFNIMYANVHVLNLAFSDPELRRILNGADLVFCDGSGVKLGARLLGKNFPERMTGADWIDDLCAASAESGTRLFFLGSEEGIAARAAEIVRARYPGIQVVGFHHGYLQDPRLSAQTVAAINAASPHILLVGMGTPIQERWIATYRDQLKVPVVCAVGALFEFVAGTQRRAPRWMLEHNLEWLFRFYLEPMRMWKRYLVGNPVFLLRLMGQRLGILSRE